MRHFVPFLKEQDVFVLCVHLQRKSKFNLSPAHFLPFRFLIVELDWWLISD